ncbi:VOC family protein [Roseivirga misakiensis]|uniref:Glyoxalase-like domain-containing protein n=1 Tax=Roseivirga misakiensis TaxID=1563681 RepID=A0A1E5T1Z8_9BACT|nr:VOC family protein [Roseivirga misakiensis]OEK05386.1 hypothetical protein BFP71_18520 [Roseivirga misakiensis]
MQRALDHIVYAVQDLDKACDDFEKLLGVRPTFGGYHPTQGTKNALIGLGNHQYLELIAIDHENKNVTSTRWMGVDLIDRPQLTRWAIKSNNLKKDAGILQQANPELGNINAGKRHTADGSLLAWELLMPLAHPTVELLPFAINWGDKNVHPTNALDTHCKLLNLEGYHPAPASIKDLMHQLGVDMKVHKAQTMALKAKIKCPLGIVDI